MTCTLRGPGTGPNGDWDSDHTFVNMGAAETGGACLLMDDTRKAALAPGRHRHHIYVATVDGPGGPGDVHTDGDGHRCTHGAMMLRRPGAGQARHVANGAPAARPMIFQPAGFDGVFADMAPESVADAITMTALNAKYDIAPLGPVPPSGG